VQRKKCKVNQRRFPRYNVHLPATIALVERNALSWDVTYTHSTRGHCETISQIGMALSFVGSRFPAEELTQPGCSLYVTVELPQGAIAGIVSVVYPERTGTNGRAGWFVGTTISQMSERDAERLAAYIEKRANTSLYVPVA
jgi:hypothetical protein